MSGTVRLFFPLLLIAAAIVIWVAWQPCPDDLRLPVGAAAGLAALALFAAMQSFLERIFGTWTEPLIILVFVAIVIILFTFSPVIGIVSLLLMLAVSAILLSRR
jgi:hypothetical protein